MKFFNKKDNNKEEIPIILNDGISFFENRSNILYDNPLVEASKIINSLNSNNLQKKSDDELSLNFNINPNSNLKSSTNINKSSEKFSNLNYKKQKDISDIKSHLKPSFLLNTNTPKELSIPNKALSLYEEARQFKRRPIYYTSNFIMENRFDNALSIGARLLGGLEADENLKMSFSHHYLDTPYAHEHKIYNSVNEVEPFLQSIVKHKIKTQLGAEYINNIKGIFIDNNTESSKKLAKNSDIYLYIRRNKEFLKNYGFIKQDSIQFTDSNFYNAIGKAEIVDMYITNEGEIVFYIVDTYDFNKHSKNHFVRAGRTNQDKGIIKPYFMIYSVKIDKYTANRILK